MQRVTESKEGLGNRYFPSLMVPSAMNTLRMVKLFGWEGRASERIADAREAELSHIKTIKLLELVIANFK